MTTISVRPLPWFVKSCAVHNVTTWYPMLSVTSRRGGEPVLQRAIVYSRNIDEEKSVTESLREWADYSEICFGPLSLFGRIGLVKLGASLFFCIARDLFRWEISDIACMYGSVISYRQTW